VAKKDVNLYKNVLTYEERWDNIVLYNQLVMMT